MPASFCHCSPSSVIRHFTYTLTLFFRTSSTSLVLWTSDFDFIWRIQCHALPSRAQAHLSLFIFLTSSDDFYCTTSTRNLASLSAHVPMFLTVLPFGLMFHVSYLPVFMFVNSFFSPGPFIYISPHFDILPHNSWLQCLQLIDLRYRLQMYKRGSRRAQ